MQLAGIFCRAPAGGLVIVCMEWALGMPFNLLLQMIMDVPIDCYQQKIARVLGCWQQVATGIFNLLHRSLHERETWPPSRNLYEGVEVSAA